MSGKRRKIYQHRGVYKNSQSVKYANVTIPAKGPAYFRRVSCGYVERSPLHWSTFVLWLELFFSSKHMASNWPGCIYGVRRRETAPSLAALWPGRKKQRFSGTNQKPELPRPFGSGPLKPCPQGLVFAFLTFLWPNFFLARLDFSPAPLTAPGSPKIVSSHPPS